MHNYRYAGAKTEEFDEIKKVPGPKREISVILATYNEQEIIEKSVKAISSKLKGVNFEILIVDDSKDRTPEIIYKLAKKSDGRVIALHRHKKRGLWSAILDGVHVCHGEYILMMDCDFSHDPNIIPVLIAYKNDYDIVSASRFMRGGRMEAPFFRKYGSILINLTAIILLNTKKITDFAGGFHLINKEKFDELKFKYKPFFGEYSIEVVYRAVKKGFKIKEVPLVYKFRKEGTSKMGTTDYIGLIKFAYYYFKMIFKLKFFG